jgi:hypothetical protein
MRVEKANCLAFVQDPKDFSIFAEQMRKVPAVVNREIPARGAKSFNYI